jgi:imidazolonepropionase-like amidohydrolase
VDYFYSAAKPRSRGVLWPSFAPALILQLAGLTFPDVLSMLTINPVEEFHLESHAGRLRVGYDGDITVLSEDPSSGDLRKFAHVLYTIRAGRVIFDAGPEH